MEKPEDYPYSSYRSYVSGEKEDIVYTDLILEMISRDRKESSKRYKEFVEKAIGDKLESPLKGIYGGIILGGEQFVKQALGRIKEAMINQEDISGRRELQAVWRTEDIIEAVDTYFNVSRHELFGEKGLARGITIYLLKRHTGLTNRHIGGLFGDLSYSGVSKAYQRFSARLSKDRSLGETIKKTTARMSNVKV